MKKEIESASYSRSSGFVVAVSSLPAVGSVTLTLATSPELIETVFMNGAGIYASFFVYSYTVLRRMKKQFFWNHVYPKSKDLQNYKRNYPILFKDKKNIAMKEQMKPVSVFDYMGHLARRKDFEVVLSSKELEGGSGEHKKSVVIGKDISVVEYEDLNPLGVWNEAFKNAKNM